MHTFDKQVGMMGSVLHHWNTTPLGKRLFATVLFLIPVLQLLIWLCLRVSATGASETFDIPPLCCWVTFRTRGGRCQRGLFTLQSMINGNLLHRQCLSVCVMQYLDLPQESKDIPENIFKDANQLTG